MATNYPKARSFRDIDTLLVCEAFLEMFSRVGIHREMMSNNGVQFRAELMQQMHKLLGLFSPRYITLKLLVKSNKYTPP